MELIRGFKPLTEIEQAAVKEQFRMHHNDLVGEIAASQALFPGSLHSRRSGGTDVVERIKIRQLPRDLSPAAEKHRTYMSWYYYNVRRPKELALRAAQGTPQAEPR